jgi:hypothetical protein
MAHPEHSRSAVVAAMVCSAAMSAQFVAGKAARDALFLATADVTALPAMVALTAVASIGLVALSSLAFRRMRPARLVTLAFGASALFLLLDWITLDLSPGLVARALYVQVSGLGPLLGSGFWLLAVEHFHPRAARRHFGQITAVGTLAGLGGALLAERVGAMFGIASMLPVLALLNGVCAISVRRFAPADHDQRPSAEALDSLPELAPESPQSGLRALARVPYLQNLALLVLLGTVAATLADYVFKANAVEAFGRGDALLRFFAIYYAAVSLVSFVVQTTAGGLALERLGLAATVSTPSVALAAGALASVAVPGLDGVMMARGAESVLRGSLFKTAYEIFFTPVAPQDKRAAKSIIDVGLDRMGDAAGAGVITAVLALPGSPSSRLMLVTFACSVAAVVVALRLGRGYIRTLEQNLLNRAIELDLDNVTDLTTRTSMLRTQFLVTQMETRATQAVPIAAVPSTSPGVASQDPEVERLLALRSRDAGRVRAALKASEELPGSLVAHVIPLLAWDTAAEEAMHALRTVAERHIGQLVDAFIDPNQPFAVRRRLVRVCSVCTSQRAADGVILALDDARFEVRFHAGRSLVAIVEKNALIRIPRERMFDLVRREVAVSRPVWESHFLLDEADAGQFPGSALERRASQSQAPVVTFLSLVLPAVPLQVADHRHHAGDAGLRGTALEYLEGVLPPDIRERLWPFVDAESVAARAVTPRTRDEVLAELMRSNESLRLDLGQMGRRAGGRGAKD